VWVGTMMVVLLGMGAVVIDTGALYLEKQELQDGADAAALAVAKDCAEGTCVLVGGTARDFADHNAGDGEANVDQVCGSDPLNGCSPPPPGASDASGWVRVRTSTDDPDNPEDDTEVELVLAPLLDIADLDRTVRASAEAAWGPVANARTIPLIFSVCEFDSLGRSLDDGASLPQGEQLIFFSGTEPAEGCLDGLRGGFRWLPDDDCERAIERGGEYVPTRTSRARGAGCGASHLRNRAAVIPLFDQRSGNRHRITGFAGFRITGYRNIGAGGDWGRDLPPVACQHTFPGDPPTIVDFPCIRGEFIRIATGDGEFGDVEDYGAHAVTMVG
jgi:hypothetical protein